LQHRSYQSYVEKFLGLPVNGVASQADCDKVASWQRDNGIKPAAGYAGPVTYSVMKRKVAALSRQSYCPSYSRVVCVDLTSQMMWISQYGKRVWGPFAIRSGRDGYETRTTLNRGGHCPNKSRAPSTTARSSTVTYPATPASGIPLCPTPCISTALLPFTPRLVIYDSLGSHGCVHILPNKAAWLWSQMPLNTKVYVFGRKPGT
jgi:hypothetical protein